MESGWQPWAGRLVEEDGRVQVLDAGGKELEEGRRLPASERGFRQRDMEAEPGFSAEALLSGGNCAAAVVELAAAAAAVVVVVVVADQTACPGVGWVPVGGRRWTEGRPLPLVGETAGAQQRRLAGGLLARPGSRSSWGAADGGGPPGAEILAGQL